MKDGPITDIVRQVRFACPEDGPNKVVGILRALHVHALPVIQNGRVVGIVTERSVLAHLSDESASPGAAADFMERNPPCANIYMSIGQAADVMNTTGADMLPVIDEFASYRGVVTRSDVLASILDVLRPPMVAGMATPLGVHLTTGSVSAGAGSLGLYLAGVALMLMMEAARGVLWFAAFLADRVFSTHLVPMLLSPPTGAPGGITSVDMINYLSIPLQIILMMLFLRLSPMSSYHAAEHQVVHTIEAGEPLSPENVSRMPRAHPRCGTNLMAAATMFTVIVSQLGSGVGVIVAMLVVVLGWRTVGYYLQQYVTTKPAGRKYIQNGIKVGEELVAKYRREPNKSVDALGRIWNVGIPQVALGFSTVLLLDALVAKILGLTPWM